MHTQLSKKAGSLLTALVMVFTMLGVPSIPARAGVPASVHFALNSLSAPITTITRVSVDSSGAQGIGDSSMPVISANGRYVAFQSSASNLVSGDTNGTTDLFLRDTQTGTTTCISVDSSGIPGNDDSYSLYPSSISADGRYVAFESDARNLVSVDTNMKRDIFLRDTQAHTTTLVSVDSSGAQGWDDSGMPSISADGHYVAFSSSSYFVSGDTNGIDDIFLRDTQAHTTTLVSVASNGTLGNGLSWEPSISADGRYVAFASKASTLVSGDTNGKDDIFLRDTQTHTTTLVSVNSSGGQGNDDSSYAPPSISADGRYVAFFSYASNLVSGDTNGAGDVFLRDTQTNTTTRISVDSSGKQSDGAYPSSISADGRYVAFDSTANNLVSGDTNGNFDVFVVPAPTISQIYLPLVVR